MNKMDVLKYLSNTLLSNDYIGFFSLVTIVYLWTVIGGILINTTKFEIIFLIVPIGCLTSIIGTIYIVRITKECREEVRKGVTSKIDGTRVEGDYTSFEIKHIEDRKFTVRLVGEKEAVRFLNLKQKDTIENRLVANKI